MEFLLNWPYCFDMLDDVCDFAWYLFYPLAFNSKAKFISEQWQLDSILLILFYFQDTQHIIEE